MPNEGAFGAEPSLVLDEAIYLAVPNLVKILRRKAFLV
jgi:hypothetical protein